MQVPVDLKTYVFLKFFVAELVRFDDGAFSQGGLLNFKKLLIKKFLMEFLSEVLIAVPFKGVGSTKLFLTDF